MAFNIRNYLGITNPPGVINHDNDLHPIPDDLLDRLDRDVNELISYTVGAKASKVRTVKMAKSPFPRNLLPQGLLDSHGACATI